jgi:phenylpyruvate tautomerase PptA (4-oxalocrotonate tautomerase family)
MPLIKVQTSVAAPEETAIKTLLTTLSTKLAKHLGKPESYVMTAFEPGVKMSFAGTFDPVCYIEVKSVGKITADKTKSMSEDFCQEVAAKLGVPANRTYIEFADAPGAMWGWNGSTFG